MTNHRIIVYKYSSYGEMHRKAAWYASIATARYSGMSFNFECMAYNRAVDRGIVFG